MTIVSFLHRDNIFYSFTLLIKLTIFIISKDSFLKCFIITIIAFSIRTRQNCSFTSNVLNVRGFELFMLFTLFSVYILHPQLYVRLDIFSISLSTSSLYLSLINFFFQKLLTDFRVFFLISSFSLLYLLLSLVSI